MPFRSLLRWKFYINLRVKFIFVANISMRKEKVKWLNYFLVLESSSKSSYDHKVYFSAVERLCYTLTNFDQRNIFYSECNSISNIVPWMGGCLKLIWTIIYGEKSKPAQNENGLSDYGHNYKIFTETASFFYRWKVKLAYLLSCFIFPSWFRNSFAFASE